MKTIESRLVFSVGLFLSYLFLGLAYFTVVPTNAGPEEINHVQAAWYLTEGVSNFTNKELEVQATLPNSIRLENAEGYLENLDCFSQNISVPSSCQEREIIGSKSETIPLIKRSIVYPLLIGTSMRLVPIDDKYFVAKATSFCLCFLLLLWSFLLISKSNRSSTHLLLVITSTSTFFSTVVNPSSLEIFASIFFISVLLFANPNKKSFRLLFWFGFMLIAFNRSMGFVWVMFFLTLRYVVTKTHIFPKSTTVFSVIAVFTQLSFGNVNYPMSKDDAFNPPWNFYLEELLRVLNGSGEWIVSIWGTLSWSEIRMPLILVFVNLCSIVILFLRASSGRGWQRSFLIFSFLGFYVIAVLFSVAFSKSWPGFWQGRYSIPAFIGIGMFILYFGTLNKVIGLWRFCVLASVFSNLYMVLLTYARFNWGLYPTNTPIIINGNSFNPATNTMFFLMLALHLTALFLYLLKDQVLPGLAKKSCTQVFVANAG